MADTVLIDIEIPKKGFLNIDADIPEKEAIEVNSREQSFIFHDELFHRDLPNQHPIGAIAGLQAELDIKATKQALVEETERATIAEQALGERIDNIPQPDLSPYAKKSDLARVATTGKYEDLTGKPSIPSQAADVHALPDTTKYGSNISLGINPTTFVITLQLKDQNGNNLGSPQTVDLPLESVVVNGSYDSQNKKIILTLENGNTIDVPVGDLVAGLQTEITAQNKLSSDLVDDANKTNKFVTSSEKTNWNNKISGVKVNGTELTPDSNHKVDVSVPTESTVSGWGFTKNVGTVTSVNNTSPDSSGNVTITIPDPLPSQTGQSGKYLTTNGTTASWGAVNAGIFYWGE